MCVCELFPCPYPPKVQARPPRSRVSGQGGFPDDLMLKIARILYTQSRTGGSENGTVPKWPLPTMAETDCDVVCSLAVGNKHWMFDTRLADVVNQ